MTLSKDTEAKSVVPEVQAGPRSASNHKEAQELNNNQDPKEAKTGEPEVPAEAPLAVEEDYEIVEPVHHDEQFEKSEVPVVELEREPSVQDETQTPTLQDPIPVLSPEVHESPDTQNQVLEISESSGAEHVTKLETSSADHGGHELTLNHPTEQPAHESDGPEVLEASNGRALVPELTVDKTGSKEIAPLAAVNGNIDRTEAEQDTPKAKDTVTHEESTVIQEEAFVVIKTTSEEKVPEETTLIQEDHHEEQISVPEKLHTVAADLSSGPIVQEAEASVEHAAETEEDTQENGTDKKEIHEKIPEIVENAENQTKNSESLEIQAEKLERKDDSEAAVIECTDDSTTLQSSRCDVSACKRSAGSEIEGEVPDIDQQPTTEADSTTPNDETTNIHENSDSTISKVALTETTSLETSEQADTKLLEDAIPEPSSLETNETVPGQPSEKTPSSPEPCDLARPIPIVVISCPVSDEAAPLAAIHEDCELGATPAKVSMTTSSPTPPPRKISPSGSASSPVAPPRRPSTAGGTLSRSVSRATIGPKSSPSGASTFNRAGSQGRLQFNALPRNSHPPTREEVGKKKKGMFSWLGGNSSKKNNKEVLETVSEGLRKIYKQKLYPLEEHFKFHEFHSPALDDPDFDAKPMILLVGQYSTGKTTFIRHLLERDFPGIRIGPEPTTDRFIAVMHGDEEGVIPGNALVVDAKKQFRALSGFGNAFLNRFQCSTLPSQVLESVTIVDTPGILSGEKQRIDRGYDFTGVLEWFAERVDRIILLFDAHKLDISDEFKRCIEALAGNEDKIRIVLNKSDMVDHQQLMRVYGALMWSLGKVFRTPEVSRVYIGSFWDHPLHYDMNRRLFQDEQHDLFQDLQALPRNAALRKLNDLIKRARLAKVHAYIISELRKQMPSMIGKEKKKKELIQNLDKIFEQLQREHNISPGDFPDVNKMREKLQNQDFTKFNPMKPKLLEVVDGMLASDIARLMAQIPKEEQVSMATNGCVEQPTVRGGAFSGAQEAETPFGFGRGEGFDKGADESEWVVSRERVSANATFDSLEPVDGYVSGRAAKEYMVKSKLPNAVLGKIWKLADVDKDGQLDSDEFALADYLINLKLEGHELPSELPDHLVPPSKREQAQTVYPNLGDDE